MRAAAEGDAPAAEVGERPVGAVPVHEDDRVHAPGRLRRQLVGDDVVTRAHQAHGLRRIGVDQRGGVGAVDRLLEVVHVAVHPGLHVELQPLPHVGGQRLEVLARRLGIEARDDVERERGRAHGPDQAAHGLEVGGNRDDESSHIELAQLRGADRLFVQLEQHLAHALGLRRRHARVHGDDVRHHRRRGVQDAQPLPLRRGQQLEGTQHAAAGHVPPLGHGLVDRFVGTEIAHVVRDIEALEIGARQQRGAEGARRGKGEGLAAQLRQRLRAVLAHHDDSPSGCSSRTSAR